MEPRTLLTPEAIELVAARFKILGEPFRLRIIHTLQEGEKTVGELADQLGTSQPNVSKHLKLLGEAGLVTRRQQGNTVFCSIADPSVYEICDVVCDSLRQRLAAQAGILAQR
jgi:ArsR family transcriptional regulator